jgi:hypothetical protein
MVGVISFMGNSSFREREIQRDLSPLIVAWESLSDRKYTISAVCSEEGSD